MNNNKNAEKILEFIIKFKKENGFIPSVREIGKEMKLSSTSTIAYYLNKLENEGKIKRSGNKNRAIEIIDQNKRFDENMTQNDVDDVDFVSIPLVGEIAAGSPILATENIEDNFKLPTNLFHGDSLFMLKVKGTSMINAGINNGDFVIVKKQNDAENGEIVAAMWNDEATVKRFFKENGRIRLQPENDLLSPIYLDSVDIMGKVVGLIRKM